MSRVFRQTGSVIQAVTSPIQVNLDLGALAQAVVDALLAGLQALVAPLPTTFMQWVLSQLQSLLSGPGGVNVLTHVPVEYTVGYDVVETIYRQSVFVMAGLIGVVGLIQGFRVTKGSIDVYEAIGRTSILSLVGASTLLWMRPIINLTNAVADSLGGTPHELAGQSLPSQMVFGIILILATVFALLAWLKGAVGCLFVALLLCIAAPVFIVSALPLFEGLAKWWLEEMTTWLLRAVFVAVLLRLGLGIASHMNGGMEFLFALVAFWLAWTIDTKIRRLSVGAWGSVGQAQLMNRAIGAVRGAMTGNPVAAGAAAAGATP